MKKRWREKEKNDLVELGTRQWFFQRGNVNAKIVHIIYQRLGFSSDPFPIFFWPFSNIFLTLFHYFPDPFPLFFWPFSNIFCWPFSIIFLTLFQYIFLTLFQYFSDPFPIFSRPFSNICQHFPPVFTCGLWSHGCKFTLEGRLSFQCCAGYLIVAILFSDGIGSCSEQFDIWKDKLEVNWTDTKTIWISS